MLAPIAIDLRHFRSFVAVAEEGKIGRAAARLFITQPALSRQMQQLERELGVALLRRGPSGIELTDAGRDFLEKARVALEASEAALAIGRAARPHGRLVLGLPIAGGRQRWYTLARGFVERFPAVEVEIHEALSEHLQRQVADRQLDCAIAFVPTRLDGLAYARVLDEPLSVWMHPSHPLAGRSELRLSELGGVTVTLVGGPAGRGSGFNAAIRALFEGSGAEPRFQETEEVYPPDSARAPNHLSVMVPVDFPAGTVRVPLAPAVTLAFEFVQRAQTNRSAVQAFGRFAREQLGMPARHGRV